MENEAQVETSVVSNNQQGQQQSNGGDSNAASNTSATPDAKKESRGKDSGRDSGRNSRRDRNSRARRRSRSRSPVRGRERIVDRRVYVANIPFDVKWTELKDIFREKVGNVRFCQLFENEEGKPRGCGLVEFDDSASARKAIEVLNRHELRGREIVVKEDLDIERDSYGKLILPSARRGRDRERDRDNDRFSDRRSYRNGSDIGTMPASSVTSPASTYNTYGLSPQFLTSLGIKGPLNNRVFVANLDYKVNERKLEDIFRLAGKITKVKLYYDHDNKSKGFGVVEFDHPVEAVQAISMYNHQKLFDRILSVRLDKFDNEDEYNSGGESLPTKLPSGLEGIGKGLGIGGQPLNISQSMLNSQSGLLNSIGAVQGSLNAVPNSVVPQAASAAITALTNLAGNLQNLPNLAQSLAQFSNTSVAPPPIANPSIPPTGYPSASNELPPNPTPNYGTYQTVPQSISGTAQPSPYVSNQMPTNYGPPSSSVTPVASYSSVPPAAPINSYSSYEQRDYREDKFRSQTSDTVFCRNLPMSFNWQNLRDRFNEIGEVRYAEMKGHGTAIVRFTNSRDAQRACDLMNGIRIDNRPIDVDLYY